VPIADVNNFVHRVFWWPVMFSNNSAGPPSDKLARDRADLFVPVDAGPHAAHLVGGFQCGQPATQVGPSLGWPQARSCSWFPAR
jgi:hypothetical protein